jgi:ketosteroid isomerase-like protein
VNGSPNVQAIKRALVRWNSGDRTPPLDEIHPQIEIYALIASAFKGEPYRGYDGAREWLAGLDESFERWDFELDEIRERGDMAVVLGEIHARGRGSGLELDLPTALVVDFRDGRVIRIRIFQDRDEALAAGGFDLSA